MVKFSILFHKPVDLQTFENIYQDFLALVERMPDIRRRQVSAVLGSPMGTSQIYRILDIYFDDSAAMHAALRTPAGQEAGGELRRFASGSFEMIFAEVYEEAGGSTPPADGSYGGEGNA
jgi:uncharacterized protein (TIGR02118 family)